MATTPKQENGPTNGPLGKRKKPKRSKGTYLSKWLDKTMQHIQESTPSMDTYDPFISNWSSSQFAPGYERYNYVCPEPISLPTNYYNTMPPIYNSEYRYNQSVNKSIQVQRARPRRREPKAEEMSTPNNYLQPKNFTDSQDYTSLPPIVTSVADTNSNSEVNNEKDDARRYSDPCVRGLPDVARPANGDVESDSDSDSSFSGSQIGSRLLGHLLDQIASLKLANDRMNKDLMETRAELDNLRHHSAILQKGPSSSLGATPSHTPLTDNGLIGGQYSPGFLADLVREIRDAARLREEAMYSRVRAMVIERTDNGLASAEAKFHEKSLEEVKSSLRASEADKRRMMDRIIKLEDELRVLRVASGLDPNDNKVSNGNIEDSESERLRLRKEVADMRKAKQNAEDHALKLERLVTQLRSKFNGLQITNGPDSLPSEPEHEANARARRTSVNSSNNSTVVFGPVTDL